MSLSSLPLWREDRALFLREKPQARTTRRRLSSPPPSSASALRVFPLSPAAPGDRLHGFSATPTALNRYKLSRPRTAECSRPFGASFALVLVLANVAAGASASPWSAPSNATANACGLLVLLVNLLCGGFFLNEQRDASGATEGSHAFSVVRLLTGASFVNRAFEALLINEFLGAGTFEFTPKFKNGQSGGARSSITVDVAGDEVLRFFKFGDSTAVLISDLGALCGLAVGYVALAFALLKWTTRRMGVD